jgi:hypothetical protein
MLLVWLTLVTKEKSAAKPCSPCDTESSDANSTAMDVDVEVMTGSGLGDPATRSTDGRTPEAPSYTVTKSLLGCVSMVVNTSSTRKPETGVLMINSLAVSSVYAGPVRLMLVTTPVTTVVSVTARSRAPIE